MVNNPVEASRETAPPGGPHRVVIVGGGFGGVKAARALRGVDVEVTLVDRTNHHLFQPLLYQVATGVLSPGLVAPPLRSLFRRQQNVRVLLANVTRFDLERRVVTAESEHEFELPYDTLIVACGATHSYFGHPEWTAIAPGIKTLEDAVRVRSRILGAFEIAEQAESPAEREAWMTFVVVGAGPTGVELAGQLGILSHRVLRHEYRSIDPRQAKIILLDGTDNVLPTFDHTLSRHARAALEKLGVEVRLGAMATAIDTDGIEIKEDGEQRRIDARTVLWGAGVQASPLSRQLAKATGAEIDRAGRLSVGPDLSLPGHPEVFAIGDMITVPDIPGVAPAAIQEGHYVGKLIKARVGGKAEKPFRYVDKGSVATIGRTKAVAQVSVVKLWGFPAFVIWAVVHLAYLVGWGNRYEAVARWMWTLAARNRRERLISVRSLIHDEQAKVEVRALSDDPDQG